MVIQPDECELIRIERIEWPTDIQTYWVSRFNFSNANENWMNRNKKN